MFLNRPGPILLKIDRPVNLASESMFRLQLALNGLACYALSWTAR